MPKPTETAEASVERATADMRPRESRLLRRRLHWTGLDLPWPAAAIPRTEPARPFPQPQAAEAGKGFVPAALLAPGDLLRMKPSRPTDGARKCPLAIRYRRPDILRTPAGHFPRAPCA